MSHTQASARMLLRFTSCAELEVGVWPCLASEDQKEPSEACQLMIKCADDQSIVSRCMHSQDNSIDGANCSR